MDQGVGCFTFGLHVDTLVSSGSAVASLDLWARYHCYCQEGTFSD